MIHRVNPNPISRQSRRSFLAGALALGTIAVAGCRATASPGPPPTITVLALEYPVVALQQLLAQQAEAAARDVGGRLVLQVDSEAGQKSRIASAIAAKQLPDVGLVGGPDSAPLVARGLLRNLKDLLERVAGVNGDLFPPLRDLATAGPFGDRPPRQPEPVWAIPHLSLGVGCLIRSDLLASSGLPAPKTFDDTRALAKKLTNVSIDRFGWGASLPASNAADNFVQVALLDYGAALFDPAGYGVTLDPAEAVPGLGALAALYRDEAGAPLAPSGVLDWSIDQLAAALSAGTVAQSIDHGGLYARLVSGNPKLAGQIKAVPFPAGENGWYTAAATSLFVVFESRANGDRAERFVDALLQPKPFERIVASGLGSVVPPYAYLTRGPFWDNDPNYKVFASSARGDPAQKFQFATLGQPAPLTLPVAAVRGGNILVPTARAVVTGGQSPSSAAAGLRERAQTLVAEGYALQPPPTPTPEPAWFRLLNAAQRDLK